MVRFVRWALAALFTLMVLPVAQEYFIELARDKQLYENPSQRLDGVLGYVQMIADVPGFYYALALVGGLTIGVWLDSLMRRYSKPKPSKADRIRRLGGNCNNVARNAKQTAGNPFLYADDYPDLLNAYRLIVMDLRDWGIESPPLKSQELEKNAYMMYQFLGAVGSLLSHNRFDEAKDTASALLDRFNQEQQT